MSSLEAVNFRLLANNSFFFRIGHSCCFVRIIFGQRSKFELSILKKSSTSKSGELTLVQESLEYSSSRKSKSENLVVGRTMTAERRSDGLGRNGTIGRRRGSQCGSPFAHIYTHSLQYQPPIVHTNRPYFLCSSIIVVPFMICTECVNLNLQFKLLFLRERT